MRLSFLEFGYTYEDRVNSHEIIENLFQLIPRLDTLNAKRCWLGEHYSEETKLSWFSPRVLLPLVLAHTEQIRLGAGGVILNYHPPLAVAHDYLLLNALFQNRIDLGLAHSTPSSAVIEEALTMPIQEWSQTFEQKSQMVYQFLHETDIEKIDIPMPLAGTNKPDIWFLGVKPRFYSNIIQKQGNLALSLHHKPELMKTPHLLQDYKDQYYEVHGSNPEVLMSTTCYCVNSKAEEEKVRARVKKSYLRNTIDIGTLVGNPQELYERLDHIRAHFGIEEIMIHNDARDQEEKNQILELFTYADQQSHSNIPSSFSQALSA